MDVDPPAAQPVAAPAAEAEPSKAEAPPLTLDNPQVLPAFACTMVVGVPLLQTFQLGRAQAHQISHNLLSLLCADLKQLRTILECMLNKGSCFWCRATCVLTPYLSTGCAGC